MDNQIRDSITEIEFLLRSVCFKIKQKGREILQDFDITPPQFDALQFLVDDGEMTVSELSSKLYLAPSTITDLIDRMEKNNLVSRVRDTKDRRTVKIKVEEKGFKLISEVIDRRCKFIEDCLTVMSDSDRAQFMQYLQILNEK